MLQTIQQMSLECRLLKHAIPYLPVTAVTDRRPADLLMKIDAYRYYSLQPSSQCQYDS